MVVTHDQAEQSNYLQAVKERLNEKQYICIFPMGNAGKALFYKLLRVGIKADFFSDNDDLKHSEMTKEGIPCITVKELVENYSDNTTIIVESLYYKQICQGLKDKGLKNIIRIFPSKFETDLYVQQNQHRLSEKTNELLGILEDETSKKIALKIIDAWLEEGLPDNYFDDIYTSNQYYDRDIIHLSNNEYFVDCGAYNGDTAIEFLQQVGNQFAKMYLFELDGEICDELSKNIKNLVTAQEKEKVEIFPFGVSDVNCSISYASGESTSMINESGNCEGKVVRLDDALAGQKVSFIKMDIEGAECAALRGAENIIKNQHPKLAICVYHSASDLFEIPLYLKKLVPEYKIYLRHHTDMFYETVCYAVYE